jgi:DNA-binding Lrp family transcriptional regulator
MDKKDEKLITELLLNGRISYKQLSKRIGVSREVAAYRLDRMVKQGTITNFYTIINTEALGFSRFGCLLQLKDISMTKERGFFDKLVNNPYITYAGSIVGRANVAFDILAKDKTHLSNIMNGILGDMHHFVEGYIITSSSKQETFPTKVMNVSYEYEDKKFIKTKKIDETDLKLLSLLSVNARIEYKDLAGKLRLTANAVKYRLKNLEKEGIIWGYAAAVDVIKLGYEIYNVQVKVVPGEKEEKLTAFLRKNMKVIYFYRYLGQENWDMDIGVIAENSRELRKFLIELREEAGNIVKIRDIFTNSEILKPDVAPKGVFES